MNDTWNPLGDIITPKNAARLRESVRQEAFADCDICSICAIVVGAELPLRDGANFIEGAGCCGCERDVPTTKVGNWNWGH